MKKNLPPIGAQLTHPDAFFYDVRISDDNQSIVGFFEAEETAQPFQFSILTLVHVARQNCLLDQYGEMFKDGRATVFSVWIDDGTNKGITIPALDWVETFINPENGELQATLKACAAFQYEAAFPNAEIL